MLHETAPMPERKSIQASIPRVLTWIMAGLIGLSSFTYTYAEPPLRLTDATFTDEVVNRQPRNRLSSFSLGERGSQARLWFWFRVRCGDGCQDGATLRPRVRIFVKWAHHEDGKFIVKRTVPLTVEGLAWRTWAYKQNLQPGTWRVAIFTEQGPICLGDQCDFTVEVRR